MQRKQVALFCFLGLLVGTLRAQPCPCPQPPGGIAQVVACPCPTASCMTVEGSGEIGTWLKFDVTHTDTPNLFTLGPPATTPILLPPTLAVCDDLKTNPLYYIAEVCIAKPLTGPFWLYIPWDPSLVGFELYVQYLWSRPGMGIDMTPVMTSVVLSVTVRDRT